MDTNTRVLDKDHILNGKYRIEKVLGEGGFGITYLAHDLIMKELVAIKEYFPTTLATRDTTANKTGELTIITGENSVSFAKGLKRFEDEAAKLARFQREEGIVSVKNFFHENGTGYMVMEYIDGITLKEYLFQNGGYLSCEKTLAMMKTIMESLSVVHQAGIIHRDISPDNIMVTADGKMKLIDFGAARFVGSEDEKSLTVLLKEGYAPPEQYQTNGNQGPWTDVYALCATMYRMISGQVPTESVARVMQGESLVTLKHCAGVSDTISKAISRGMAPSVANRTQNISDLMKSFNRKAIIQSWFGVVMVGIALFLCAGIISFCIARNSVVNSSDIEENNAAKTENDVYGTTDIANSTAELSAKNKTQDVEGNLIENEETQVSLSEEELLDLIRKESSLELIEIPDESAYTEYTVEDTFNKIYDDFNGDGVNEMFALMRSARQEQVAVIANTELMEKPDENSNVVEVCSEGKLIVRYSADEDGWSYVNCFGTLGYVKSEFLQSKSWDDAMDINCFELWFSDGKITKEIEMTLKAIPIEMLKWNPVLLGINTIQFGKEKHLVMLCSNQGSQTGTILAETFRFDGEKTKSIATPNEEYYISSGVDGKACVKDLNNYLCLGKRNLTESEWAKVINIDENMYFDNSSYKYDTCDIYYVDGKYKEYEANEISIEELHKYEDYEIAIEEAEKVLYNMDYSSVSFSLWSDIPVVLRQNSIFVSENDKLYINYEIHTEPNVTPEEMDEWGAEGDVYNVNAVFTIDNNKLKFLTINPGTKERVSGILQE